MENSEFSFKKSPTALLRIDSKLDNFSFKKKNESPIHLQKIAENVSGQGSEQKQLLSFNLISCLDEIDKEIETKHKEKFGINNYNMDNNRFR